MHRWGMAMLQSRCSVFRSPIFLVKINHRATFSDIRGVHGFLSIVRAVRAFPPAQPACSSGCTACRLPAFLHSLGPGRRDISIWARKNSADGPTSAQNVNEPALLNPAAAEDLKPAKKGGRKKKADTGSLAEHGDAAASRQAPQGSVVSYAAGALSLASASTDPGFGKPAAADEPKPVKRRQRKKQAATTAAAQHDDNSGSQQVLRLCPDLHANAPDGAHWQRVESWVVFSDLHVGLRTIDVACQVLQRVREEAAARNAGILFLGRPLSGRKYGCPQSI